MFEAARKGFLEVVQWLMTEYSNDHLFSPCVGVSEGYNLAMDAAALHGHLNVDTN